MVLAKILFKTYLEENEELKYVAHRHLFTEWRNFAKTIIASLILPIIFYILFPFAPFLYLWILWFSIGIIRFIYKLADWYFDVWLITDLSVIDVQWNGIFDRSSSRMEYTGIKGLTYNIKGFWGTIFGYGDTTLEHAINSNNFVLEKAAHPKKIERILLNNQNEFIHSQTMSDHEALKQMLIEMLLKDKAKKESN
ncbi:hypothetical protein A2483_01095 [Candidatus Peregrinibacteria bacterium RIFOXYC2_FULL_33_13]|nr:MAG: hypothetical protein UR27_C0004G0036 [Candidatus Peregrinibacteria bacterium GW2011_GWA2_33_10]KKP41163.1 MAG: hypothetical protein UR30_C0001G0010 [Candidatus Peregrinibacteria bacterium GW2011_GWC2_33_13]OGJ50388.1 MAG: hypothetical protein A2229_00200 [Candidatus Peregrinibacteria bacterium RIFOXYA2_FULL_33_7]OGJ55263.1 MAG: hypothetical protein A2483_01095 [Candidatus Peregrinibacteria bacterium RIFOXYC2_FULL_33_13]